MRWMALGACLALLGLAYDVGAQSRVRDVPPLMTVSEDYESEAPIVLQSARMTIRVDGGIARNTVDLVFHNPNSDELEGSLQFPLLPDQQVTGFALDINGTMQPAVPVPEAQGRQAFEAIERRKVDPALLEQTEGNHFRLRVYPIPAGGERRVQLTFVETMQRDADGWRLRVPMRFAAGVASVPLRVTGGQPRVTGTFGPVVLRRESGGYSGSLRRSQLRGDGLLDLHFASSVQAQAYTQAFDGEHFFFAEVPLAGPPVERTLPKVVGLLWDSSASGRKRDHAGELMLLERYFQRARNVDVRLVRLRDQAEAERFVVRDGDWSALRASLKATVYDGATDPGGWAPDPDVGEYLLVSDGLFNYGQRRFPQLGPHQRLFALNSAGASADSVRLEALAQACRGRLIAWHDASDLQRAGDELLTESPHVVSMEAVGASDLVLASRYPQDGYLRLAGRMTRPDARVQLDVATGAGTRRIDVPVVVRDAQDAPAATLWAMYSIRALQSDPDGNRAAMGRIGQRFGIATPETSLIVLETIEDYVRYDILPPADMRAEFAALKAGQIDEQRTSRQDHLDEIAQEYAERVDWWSKSWPKGKPPVVRERKPRRSGVMYAPPAAAPAPVSAENTTLDRIEVTGSRISNADLYGTVSIQPWQPDSPYARRLRAAPSDRIYAMYLDERDSHADSSAFFLDVADILFEHKQPELALRVLSNLAEMDMENRHLLRVLGYRLMQAERPDLAAPVFERVLRISEEEPQSFRDLGLAYAGDRQYQRAIDTLYEVVQRDWDGRFGGIAMIALAEMNAVIATSGQSLDTHRIDQRLLRNLPVGLRTVLSWDADNSDMDLWVTDPNGEKCFYGHRSTYQGGRMSEDFTGGYGPEEFVLRDPKPGKYKVEANYFGDDQVVVTGATTLSLWLSTRFGTPQQQDRKVVLRLKDAKETVLVGEFEIR